LQLATERQTFGVPLPDFNLRSLTGDEAGFYKDLEGRKGAVVVFWSSTCSHCVRYDKVFNTFAERHPDLAFFVVASRNAESADAIRKAVKERGITFPILLDPGGKVAAQWHAEQTPRTFLTDHEGKLLYRGAVDNFKYPEDSEYLGYLEPAIADFFAGRPIGRSETASFGCAIQSVYYILPRSL